MPMQEGVSPRSARRKLEAVLTEPDCHRGAKGVHERHDK